MYVMCAFMDLMIMLLYQFLLFLQRNQIFFMSQLSCFVDDGHMLRI